MLKFISTQPCILCLYLFVSPLQIQCPALIINILQALLLQFLFSKYQFIPCCPWSEVCMILAFLPTHSVLASFFSVISFELPITWTFFDFPRRFELSGVDCLLLTISHRRRRDYSPIFTSPEATNCLSIITLMILRENKIIDQFPTPKHQHIGLPFWKLLAFNVIITARWL